MNREAEDSTPWPEAFPQEAMIDREFTPANDANWNDLAKAPSEAGNYRPMPQEAPPDALDRFWNFLQQNFLLLFPISLFLLFAIFAAVMAASP